MKKKKYILEIAVFICGAVVMIFEIVGSRVLAPYMGVSIYTWTSLIGIILASLSIGYWLGGRIADKDPKASTLSIIILLAAFCIAATTILKGDVLDILQKMIHDLKWNSIIATIILFSPASVLLGMVSPYAIRLKMKSLNTSGSTVGTLYAISTLGSIVGTFTAGFYLIPMFGTTNILLLLSIILIIASALVSISFVKINTLIIIIIAGTAIVQNLHADNLAQKGFIDTDSQYSRIWIYNSKDEDTSKPIRKMSIDGKASSAIFLEDDELVFQYARLFRLAEHFHPKIKQALLFGGAAYTIPMDFVKRNEEAKLDVVEIDSKLTKLAKKYFRLKDHPNMEIHHQDGRIYLNKTKKRYDVILGDAFSSLHSIPYQLTTIETVKRKYDILNDNGIVVMNIISAIEGDKGQFFRSEYATYKKVFPHVLVFPVQHKLKGEKIQNIVLVALKSNEVPILENENLELSSYLEHLWTKKIALDMPILTDEHAPVNYYISKAL